MFGDNIPARACRSKERMLVKLIIMLKSEHFILEEARYVERWVDRDNRSNIVTYTPT